MRLGGRESCRTAVYRYRPFGQLFVPPATSPSGSNPLLYPKVVAPNRFEVLYNQRKTKYKGSATNGKLQELLLCLAFEAGVCGHAWNSGQLLRNAERYRRKLK